MEDLIVAEKDPFLDEKIRPSHNRSTFKGKANVNNSY
jgi:hypothetical protein